MNNAVRGTTIHFQVTFYDIDNQPTTTASAMLSINFIKGDARVTQEFPMIFDAGGVWYTYDWQTADDPEIQPCTVQWSVVSDITSPPVYANEGCFELLANAANLGE